MLALVELRDGRLQVAEEAAKEIDAIDPSDSRGPLMLAAVRAAQEDYKGVVAVLDRRVSTPLAADISSGAFAEMATRLADAWLEVGNEKRAVATLEGAHARVPDDTQIAFSLASTYEQTKAFDKAEKAFREIIEADPDHAGALNYLGYMLADRGRKLPEALKLIERALVIEPDNAAYLDSLGWAYFKLKRYNDAVGPLERAAADATRSSVIQDHLGDAYVKLGRHADAADAFDRALKGDRDGIDADRITKKRDQARASAKR
jgi:tetratricopeptide (TPR) repeat protein